MSTQTRATFAVRLSVLLTMLFIPAPARAATTVSGERIDPSAYGPGIVEGWDAVLLRDLNRPADAGNGSRGRNGAQGVWVVPSRGATYHPHSGAHYITNKWGDTSMGIGFGRLVDVEGVHVAGQAGRGAWTTGLRAIGYREGTEVAVTEWFEDIDDTPSFFAIDLEAVDRIVFESRPVLNGGGWYALDDLAFTPLPRRGQAAPAPVVLDFEDTNYRQVLTGSNYAGLTWETGTGPFTDGDAVHAPMAPPGAEADEERETQGFPAMPMGAATTPELLSTFEGIRRGDEGQWSYPPDTCGAVGPNHFLSVVNRVIAAFDRETGDEIIAATLGAFLPGSSGDPRVLYDQHSGRWIVLITDFSSRIFLAVSSTDDPTGDWFKTNFTVSQGSDAGRWPDYPTLGVDEFGVYTSAYMVGGGNTMSIFAIDKEPLIDDPPSLGTVTAFRGLPWEGAIQPVHTYGSAEGEYFISRGGANLKVRLLTGPLTEPELSGPSFVEIPSHASPPDAPALGSNTPLDTVGPRLMNAVYRDGSIWTAHTIGYNGRAACRWYRVDVAEMALAQGGTVLDSSLHYFFPSITVNAQGDAVMGFTGSNEDQYAATYYTGRRYNDAPQMMADPVLYREGEGAQNNIDGYGRNRWGDYSLCSLDPVDETTMWTIQEYGHANNVWGTQVASLTVPDGPAADHCGSNIEVYEGVTEFSNVDATTDGPDEPDDCTFDGYSHIESDIWYRFNPLQIAEITVSLCGSDFDTKLAVYAGCPTGSGQVIACNDDFCGEQSEVTFISPQEWNLQIRIGGKYGAQGDGIMTITVTPLEDPCPADFDDNGVVDTADLLVLLGAWGTSGPEGDVDDDGDVDTDDLLALLGAWGDCPDE
ncbi:MAG: hypothetical protein SYC29_10295 [Planctomycetota bacterium]|nr:hypothetical protein [Planctomycetota bacterium]